MIEVPKEVNVTIQGHDVAVKGPKGEVKRTFKTKGLTISQKDGGVEVDASKTNSPRSLKRTVESHIENMVKGVTEGYTKRMQVVYSHFPVTVEVKGDKLMIKNFIGEKKPRQAPIRGKTKVEVKKTDIVITGPSKEDVGQTAANIRTATRIRDKDSRIFQDGIYFVQE